MMFFLPLTSCCLLKKEMPEVETTMIFVKEEDEQSQEGVDALNNMKEVCQVSMHFCPGNDSMKSWGTVVLCERDTKEQFYYGFSLGMIWCQLLSLLEDFESTYAVSLNFMSHQVIFFMI